MLRHQNIRFEIKEVTNTGAFSGYGSVYDVVDQGNDIVAKGAFTESLADHAKKGSMPALLWQHRSDQPIGAYQKMKEDGYGLQVEGKLALKVQQGAEAHELMMMKAVNGLSIGFQTRSDSYDQKTDIRTILKADLWEVSVVTFPMNDAARISAVKSVIEGINDFRSAEQFLRDSCNFSKSESVAFVSRVKGLARSDSGAANDEAATAVIAALKNRIQLINS